tara:strand:- start:1177 stop:2742 length:1566 start_codon:yes stop_codon:yes gene_type:complete
MANITIVKLKVRRGSDAQRKEIVLDQGEVGYTLDSKRLFVGDGSTYGGKVAGNVNVGPFNDATSLGPAAAESPYLQVGDIGYADSKLYILTGAAANGREYTNDLSGWGYIGNVPDDTFLEFNSDNELTIKKQSIDAQYIGSTFFGDGLLSSHTVPGQATVALNAQYLGLSTDRLDVKRITPTVGSITKRELATFTDTASGIKGGTTTDGVTEDISLSVNESQFKFDSNKKLELKDIGSVGIAVSSWAGGGTGTLLGAGLEVNTANQLEAAVQSVDGSLLTLTNGQVTLNGSTSAYQEMPYLNVEQGLITDIQSSIFDVITATGLSGAGAGDGVPIGSILPHAQAFTTPPAGYLLCNGHALDGVTNARYINLFEKIGTVYGGTGMSEFRVPSLTGGDVMLYGADGAITAGTKTLWLSGTEYGTGATTGGAGGTAISAVGVNFIIKYAEDPVLNIFNGAPNQVENEFGGKYTQQVCYGKDSSAAAVTLSSAGFITMALSGNVRNPENTDNNTYDRFAIPVYSY